MRGYLIWLIVALACTCSSMAEDPTKDPAISAAQDPEKDASKDPANDAAQDAAKVAPRDPAQDLAKEPASDAAQDSAKDLQQLKSTLDVVLKDIKSEKRWMHHVELMEQGLNQYIANITKEIPKMETELLNVEVELAKVNVKLERKQLVVMHCLDSEKTNEDIRRIAKERVDKKVVELDSNAKKELRRKYQELLSELTVPWTK